MRRERSEPVRGGATTLVSIAAAALLVALKLGVGLATNSLGLISAGIESSGDVLAAVLTFFAVRLGGRPADRGHPYGHRRAENLGALGEAAILIGGARVRERRSRQAPDQGGAAPEIRWYQFAVIGVALVVDLSRMTVSLIAARRYGSPALRSNALHFAADMARLGRRARRPARRQRGRPARRTPWRRSSSPAIILVAAARG